MYFLPCGYKLKIFYIKFNVCEPHSPTITLPQLKSVIQLPPSMFALYHNHLKRSKALKHPTSQLCHQNKQTIFYLQIILLVPNGFTHGIQDVFVKSGLTTLARPCMCTPEVETINSLVKRDEMCVCSTKHLPSGLLVKAIIVLTLPPSVTLSLYKNLTCTYSSTISIPLIV